MHFRKQETYKNLNLGKKYAILRSLKRHVSISKLSKKFCVSKRVICGLKKWSSKMVHFIKGSEFNRRTETPQTEEALSKWLKQQKAFGSPVTVAMIRVQAQQIHAALQESKNFTASRAWVEGFKRRLGLRATKMQGRNPPGNPSYDIKDYWFLPEQVYRVYRMTLLWRFRSDNESPERLTLLCCANVTGTHKLKPMIIGPTLDSGTTNLSDESTVYMFSKNSQLTTRIFCEWVSNYFIKEVFKKLREKKLPLRVILLFDEAVCIRPPIIQLMIDGGCIRTMELRNKKLDSSVEELVKLEYKKCLISKVLATNNTSLTLADTIENIRLAWDAVKPASISGFWNEIIYDEHGYNMEDYKPLATIKSNMKDYYNSGMELKALLNCIKRNEQILNSKLGTWLMSGDGMTEEDSDYSTSESQYSEDDDD